MTLEINLHKKGIVHPKMKNNPFIHPQALLCGFVLSDEYNQSYIKKCPGSSKLYNGSEWGSRFWSPKYSHHKKCPTWWLIKAFWSDIQ